MCVYPDTNTAIGNYYFFHCRSCAISACFSVTDCVDCFLTVLRSSKVFSQNPAAPEKRLDNRFARDWRGLQRAFPIFAWLCEHLSTCQKYMQKIGEPHFKASLHCCCFWLWLQIKLADQVRAFNLHGQGVELDPKGLLSIDEDTGEITVHYAVDYEEYPVLKVWGQFLHNVRRFFFFSCLLFLWCMCIPSS